jgi:hypothetical protein
MIAATRFAVQPSSSPLYMITFSHKKLSRRSGWRLFAILGVTTVSDPT